MPRKGAKAKGAAPAVPSIADHWDGVQRFHALIERAREDGADLPALESLSEAWSRLGYGEPGGPLIERGEALRRVSENPITTLFYFLELGFYPPPELLLELLESWHHYLGSRGAITLEEAFIGRPKRGAGNYASRRSSYRKKLAVSSRLNALIKSGLSPIEAAERVSQMLGGRPDADSILRMNRRHSSWGVIPPPPEK